MKILGLTVVELVELWPHGLELWRALRRLVDARSARGFAPFQSVRDTLIDATERVNARTADAPAAPSAAEQSQFDRASRPDAGGM